MKGTKLYIDFQDPNLIFHSIDTLTLQHYIDKNGIKLLILDHYEVGTLKTFPNVERIIVISRVSLNDKAFTTLELFPLDYEEFLGV